MTYGNDDVKEGGTPVPKDPKRHVSIDTYRRLLRTLRDTASNIAEDMDLELRRLQVEELSRVDDERHGGPYAAGAVASLGTAAE